MQTIRMTTMIAAPVERCFQLSLSIDLEAAVMARWGVRAIEGVTCGIIGDRQQVTWQGWQFGLPHRHTLMVSGLRAPTYFREVMERGSFASFVHEHHFATMNDGTRMRDELRFALPLGFAGQLAERLVQRRLEQMLGARRERIRRAAESEQWRRYLAAEPAPAA